MTLVQGMRLNHSLGNLDSFHCYMHGLHALPTYQLLRLDTPVRHQANFCT